MSRLLRLLPRIAASDSTVLIEGETGTGKTMLASAIHRASPRAKLPFIVIDCGAIAPNLIESELFGHEKGAFTGAVAARAGAFEAARGGTVFLDEIGELPLDLQPKLLRAIEDHTVKRLGSTDPVLLDVRIIAATNRDLRKEVAQKRFRSDLFYRLNIMRLRVPSLRERREDIPVLAVDFYRQLTGRLPAGDLVDALVAHDWPGNVRELRSAIERVAIMGDHRSWHELFHEAEELLEPESGDFESSLPYRAAKEHAISAWERRYVSHLVRRNRGNLTHAARAARMDRGYLRELVRRHNLKASDDRE